MNISLNTKTLEKLAAAFGESSPYYKAILSAAEKSPYFASELNEFGTLTDWKFTIGTAKSGVFTNPSTKTISIASDWNESSSQFATTLAHELGHALLPNGFGGPTPNTPKDAIANNRANEGVALASEYIVAIQLGLIGGSAGNMHSDGSNLIAFGQI